MGHKKKILKKKKKKKIKKWNNMLWLYLLFIQCESVSTIQALNYGDVTFLKGRKKREGDRKKERERERGKKLFSWKVHRRFVIMSAGKKAQKFSP